MDTGLAARTTFPPAPGPWSWLRRELSLTARMMADNSVVSIPPPVLFTAAACAYAGTDGAATALHLATSTVLFTLYLYVFDTVNQARSAEEDQANKPYRPIPSGLVHPSGLLRRFWCAMPLYTILGWALGVLEWTLLWQAVIISIYLLARPRDYLWAKPIAMLLGTIAQLAAAWQLVTPLDAAGWKWVLTISIVFNLPLRFEDVRDIEGDRRIGRRTLPLITGHWPVRIWFAAVLIGLPFALYFLLFAPSPTSTTATAICTLIIALMSWTAATHSLVRHTVRADRITYQLYCLTYAAALASGIALL